MEVTRLRGVDIISQPLPDLLTVEGFRTTSDSRHNERYAMDLAHWSRFTRDVKDVADNVIPRRNECLDVIPKDAASNPCYLCREQCLCGDELSLSGRFTQNALAPATAIGRFHNVETRFGDFKTSSEGQGRGMRSIPDYAAVHCSGNEKTKYVFDSEKHRMRIVGEAKTSWMHDLNKYYNSYLREYQEDLRHAFGQVALYMHQYKMKYGFLTTYKHTIFLMQDCPKGSNEPVLYHSRPIAQNEIPRDADNGTNDVRVSVRQCLFYLLWITRKEDPSTYTYNNPVNVNKWVSGQKVSNPTGPVTPYNQSRTPMTSNQVQGPPAGPPDIAQLSLSANSPVRLQKYGETYRGEIQLSGAQIRNVDTYDPHILIDGQKIPVVIERDSSFGNLGGPPPSSGKRPSSPSKRPAMPSYAKRQREPRRQSPESGQSASPLRRPQMPPHDQREGERRRESPESSGGVERRRQEPSETGEDRSTSDHRPPTSDATQDDGRRRLRSETQKKPSSFWSKKK